MTYVYLNGVGEDVVQAMLAVMPDGGELHLGPGCLPLTKPLVIRSQNIRVTGLKGLATEQA